MTTAPQSELDLRWFFPLFIGGLLTISCLLSLIGGWHALARKYRATTSSSGKLFSFASLGLGRGFGPRSRGTDRQGRFFPAGEAEAMDLANHRVTRDSPRQLGSDPACAEAIEPEFLQ